jgi:triosephosphate isomerase
MRRKILAGNWKMNKSLQEVESFVQEWESEFQGIEQKKSSTEIFIAPSFPYLQYLQANVSKFGIKVGAQNCANTENGAFTGEVSASMLKSLGCNFVILGHSERRKYFSESDIEIGQKVKLAMINGLVPILCIGETLEEREKADFFSILEKQLLVALKDCSDSSSLIIAYEPVWAIGTGKTASPNQAQEVHLFIRQILAEKFGEIGREVPILYGGSCNPSNAKELFSCPDIDGGLIGGASLKINDFLSLFRCF